jgi:transposase
MSVCVGIDVHRKRSQVAVGDEAGTVLANRNVVNGVEQVLSAIGQYPTHTQAASRRVITDDLALIDAFAPTIDRLDAEVHRHAMAEPRVKVLAVLPGVGEPTALMILAETGDLPVPDRPQARRLGPVDPDRAGLGPDGAARAHLQAGLGVAAVDPV